MFLRADVTSSQVTGLAAVLDVATHEADTIARGRAAGWRQTGSVR